MKQMFSEKCDGYREGRAKLQKKLKKRDDRIVELESRLGQLERLLSMRDAESRAYGGGLISNRAHHASGNLLP